MCVCVRVSGILDTCVCLVYDRNLCSCGWVGVDGCPCMYVSKGMCVCLSGILKHV